MFPTLDQLQKLVNNALKFIQMRLDALGTSINGGLDRAATKIATSVSENNSKNSSQQTQLLTGAIRKLEDAVSKIKEPKFTGEINVDGSAFAKEFQEIVSEVKRASKEMSGKMPDLEPIARGLQMMVNRLEEIDNKELIREVQGLTKALKELKITAPDVIRIDEGQLRALRGGMRSGGGQQTATNVLNTTVSMPTADTEYSYTFPANTLSWRMKLRSQAAAWNYSWTTGTLKTSGDATAYMSIPSNWLDSRAGVEFSNKTIYFESGSASQTMEIEVNQM